jgi:hypothetical protein
MRKINIFLAVTILALLSSCTMYNKTIREPNVRVELKKSDFTLSDQVTAEAKSTKIFGIDFERLFVQKTGVSQGGSLNVSLASIPVIGNVVADKTANYALYELMVNNPGYDVIIYPQYETVVERPIGFGIYRITTVKVTARLGKLNK